MRMFRCWLILPFLLPAFGTQCFAAAKTSKKAKASTVSNLKVKATSGKINNSGTLKVSKSLITCSIPQTMRSSDDNFLSGNGIEFLDQDSALTDTWGNSTHPNGVFDPSVKQITTAENSVVQMTGAAGVTIIASNGTRVKGDLSAASELSTRGVLFRSPYDYVGLSLKDPSVTIFLDLNFCALSIDLNGGTAILERDLKFSDDMRFVNSGVVSFNGKTLSFGGKSLLWDTDIVWEQANDLQLNSTVVVASVWYFDGDSHLAGNGNTIDLSLGGILWVKRNSSVLFSNVKIKGLGSGSIVFEDKTSQLRLTSAQIEMDSDYTFTTGGIYVEGQSNIIVKDHILEFDLASSLTIDGVSLTYDTLEFVDQDNIKPVQADDPNLKNITYLNNGVIRRFSFLDTYGEAHYEHNISLTSPFVVYPSKRLFFDSSVALNGNSQMMSFSRANEPLIFVADGVSASVSDIVLHNFSPSYVSLGIDSDFVFKDKTVIELAKNETLETTWTIEGNCILNGNGQALTLGSAGNIVVNEAGSSLLFENITLKGVSGDNIRCLDNTCTLSFKNVMMQLDDDYSIETGQFAVLELLDVRGTYSFAYASSAQSLIDSGSVLQLSDGACFYYEPSVANNNLIKMEDDYSTLRLNGATLASTSTGMHLTKGTVQIWGEKNYLTVEPVAAVGLFLHMQSLALGVQLGDASDVNNNVALEFNLNGKLTINSGTLIWANVEDTGSDKSKKYTHKIVNASIDLKSEPELIFRSKSSSGSEVLRYPLIVKPIDEAGRLGYSYSLFRNIGSLSLINGTLTLPNGFGGVYVAGNEIIFDSVASTLQDAFGNKISFIGEYKPYGSAHYTNHEIIPDMDTEIRVAGDVAFWGEVVVPHGATLSGDLVLSDIESYYEVVPSDWQPIGITLEDPTSEYVDTTVSLNLNTCRTNIDLNLGHVNLLKDLKFPGGFRFLNQGGVELNRKTLSFGGDDFVWDNDILWEDASDLQFNGIVVLQGKWTFERDAHLSFHGNMLDLTDTGTIMIKSNTILSITDTKIRGLGSGKIFFEDETAQLRLSNVEIDMDDDYTFTAGGLYVIGPTNIITRNHIMTFDLNSSMTVDSVALTYDTLGYVDNNNIRPSRTDDPDSQYITYLYDGVIRRTVVVDNSEETSYEFDVELSADTYVYPSKKIAFSSNMTLDGGSNAMCFSRANETLLTVDPGCEVYVANIVLRDFAPSYVSLGSGASFGFKDKTVIELARNETLSTAWAFEGDCILEGKGHILDLGSSGSITIDGTGSSLLISNVTLKGVSIDNIRCLNNNASIAFKDVRLCLVDDYIFDIGSFEIFGRVFVTGEHTFDYATDQQSTIVTDGQLFLDHNVTFYYNPATANRDLVKLENEQSVIYMNGATLMSTTTGMRLTKGTLIVDHKNYLINDYATKSSQAIAFGSGTASDDLHVEIMPGASLDVVSGYFDYKNVS